jgi:septal ring-binding cell division protein DamX
MHLRAVALGLGFLSLLVVKQACAKERCVPDAKGEWLCGANITPADAAPLPKPTQSSAPPVLLIDPRRFGEVDRVPLEAPTASPTAAATASTASETSTAPPKSVQKHSQSTYTVQLALATSTRGFDALLRKLGIGNAQTRRVKLISGMWALIYGKFDSIEQARRAIPKGAPGAFARANLVDQ